MTKLGRNSALASAMILAGLAATAVWMRPEKPRAEASQPSDSASPQEKVIVSDQAQRNLGLTARPLKAQTYWKTIQVPGMVVDRVGQSDRGVVAPATGVVTKVNYFPGDTVRPGDELFTLKLLSETLHLTQTELFKTTQEISLVQAQRRRLAGTDGAIPEARIIEVDNQIARLEVAAKAYRHELLNRGFSPELISGVAAGKFVNEIPVVFPTASPEPKSKAFPSTEVLPDGGVPFEMQELKVELGQQVQAGQTLCLLANHRKLAIEGRAFRDETPLLEKSVREKWPVEVDFQEDPSSGWGELKQTFPIRHMANTIDPIDRTFAFLMPLENDFRLAEDDGNVQTLWRFRPGQKVRLLVRVEELKNVFVLPTDAVSREGPEAFIFTQNVNTFERKPVHVLLQDRQHVVLANDGSLPAGSFVVQSAAAQLSRMVKAGSSGVPKGYHIHADGSLHKNEAEGE